MEKMMGERIESERERLKDIRRDNMARGLKFYNVKTRNGREVIQGKNKKTGEYELQSVLIPIEEEQEMKL
jgi:hypothetical protein